MSAVWSTPLEALAPVSAVHPDGPVSVSLLLSDPNAANSTARADGAPALSASDVTALPKFPVIAATWYQGSRPDMSMIVQASDRTGPVGATCTFVIPVTLLATRAAGAAHTAVRTTPAAPESVEGLPTGSHQLWASSATHTDTPLPATDGRQATRANTQSPGVFAIATCTGRAAG